MPKAERREVERKMRKEANRKARREKAAAEAAAATGGEFRRFDQRMPFASMARCSVALAADRNTRHDRAESSRLDTCVPFIPVAFES